jgi:hypothetical protein
MLLSAFFGVLAIPMIYVVGRKFFNEEAGLVGALILALSSFNVYNSQEARMHNLTVLLASSQCNSSYAICSAVVLPCPLDMLARQHFQFTHTIAAGL